MANSNSAPISTDTELAVKPFLLRMPSPSTSASSLPLDTSEQQIYKQNWSIKRVRTEKRCAVMKIVLGNRESKLMYQMVVCVN